VALAAKSMVLSLVTSVLNLGFSQVVKSVGMRNCLNPELKITADISLACGAELFGSGIPWGLGKHWANRNTRQRRGLVWKGCLRICYLGEKEEHCVIVLV